MKKIFKILGIIILILLIALFTAPIIFKGKILKVVKTEINKNVDAKVDFGNVNISLFSYFPNLKFEINDISVTGIDKFKNDKLVTIKTISTKINVAPLLKNKIEILSVKILNPKVYAHKLKTGKANWEIAKTVTPSSQSKKSSISKESKFSLTLKDFTIQNANIIFKDDSQKLSAFVNDLSYSLSGNMKLSNVILNMLLKITSLSIKMDGIKYLSNAEISYNAKIDADMKEMKFTLSDNKFTLNQIALSFMGYVKMIDDKSIFADVKFATNKNQFKDLLSLVPAVFTKDYKEIKTEGNMQLNGFVKGEISETQHPTFALNLVVNKAGFQYPDLPAAASDIFVNLNVSNPDGIDDHTVINLKKFNIQLGGNPFSAHYIVRTPISDPAIEGFVKGKINFNTLKDVIPVKDIQMNGILTTDIYMKGNLSSIEKQRYEDFNAKGSFGLTNFVFKTKDLDYDIIIKSASVNVAPKYFTLKNLDGKIGKSDFHTTGKIQNFLGFYFKDKTLKGNFNFSSSLLDLNQLIPKTTQTTSNNINSTPEMKTVTIPENIDFALNLNLNKILFDKMKITNLWGKLTIDKSVASMKNIKMNLIGGTFRLNGSYIGKTNPKVHMDMDIAKIDIPKAFNTFNTVKKLAPVAKNCRGKISLNLNLDTTLDNKMQPILNSMNGSGKVTSENIIIGGSKTLTKISSLLKNDKYKQLNLKNINAKFKLVKGDIIVSPVNIKINNSKAVFSGRQSVDMKMDYLLKIDIPYKDLGNTSDVIQNLKSKGDKWLKYIDPGEAIKIDLYIKGTLQHPKISLGMKDLAQRLKDKIVADLKKKAAKEARKQADKILTQADNQAQKLMKEATKRANQLRKAGKKTANKAKTEANKKIDEMVNQANGAIAKALAQEAGKRLKKEADKKANLIEREANKKADILINETKKQIDKIKIKSQKIADELIKKAEDSIKL